MTPHANKSKQIYYIHFAITINITHNLTATSEQYRNTFTQCADPEVALRVELAPLNLVVG